jgi:hypothetical protein
MLGFIKNLFNGILSFFAGLFDGFTGLFSKKRLTQAQPEQAALKPATAKKQKTKGFFMELDEETEVNGSQIISNSVAAAKSAAQGLAKAAEPVAAKVTEATQGLAKAAEPVAAKVTGATKEPAKAAKLAATTATKEPAKTQESTNANSGKVKLKPEEVELVQTAEGVKAEPKKPAKTPSPNGQSHTETTFAPKYLIPSSSNSRRRPGPNMNPFLDMARQVNNRG